MFRLFSGWFKTCFSLCIVLSLMLVLYSFVKGRDEVVPEVNYEFSGGAGFYNYAPSVIQDEYGIRYAFVCQNLEPFKIVDYIYLYKGIPTKNGYKWQPGTRLLDPSDSGWDINHVCDPDVRKFRTTYNGEVYEYIMTYLGTDQWDNHHNQIGLAISKNIEGPYIKFDKNPIIGSESLTKWGVGQSTSVVMNDSTLRMFYSNSNGGFTYRDMVINNLNNIRPGEEKKIPDMGSNNYPAFSKKNIYMVSERRVEMDSKIPTWVGNVSELSFVPIEQDLSRSSGKWKKIGAVTPAVSGFPRNHNPGILTDQKGYMINDDELIMYFTPAMTGTNWLWSYDIYSARFDLTKFFKK
ncbi:hypothetical protein [Arcticibacter sp.]|uniref:hypothetical protein n=1 Tax=Arcticibacter sp. TaxID=1872630 RepID=UPI00388E3CBF